MTLRQMIKNQIIDYINDRNIELTQGEIATATFGVEYYISEAMADSVKDSVSSILYDRELDSKKN
jgi:hypothetical protein